MVREEFLSGHLSPHPTPCKFLQLWKGSSDAVLVLLECLRAVAAQMFARIFAWYSMFACSLATRLRYLFSNQIFVIFWAVVSVYSIYEYRGVGSAGY